MRWSRMSDCGDKYDYSFVNIDCWFSIFVVQIFLSVLGVRVCRVISTYGEGRWRAASRMCFPWGRRAARPDCMEWEGPPSGGPWSCRAWGRVRFCMSVSNASQATCRAVYDESVRAPPGCRFCMWAIHIVHRRYACRACRKVPKMQIVHRRYACRAHGECLAGRTHALRAHWTFYAFGSLQ